MSATNVTEQMKDWEADVEGVVAFSCAMQDKLAKKREEGRGGWYKSDRCSIEYLQQLLHEHMDKGDMVDIANFAMMIWNRQQMEADR